MQSVTETLRKYCSEHKGEIFDVGFLHSKFFNHIGESSFRKFVSRIADEGLLVPVGKGIYNFGKLAVSGTFGVLYEVGDELLYIVYPNGSNAASLNPNEELTIVF